MTATLKYRGDNKVTVWNLKYLKCRHQTWISKEQRWSNVNVIMEKSLRMSELCWRHFIIAETERETQRSSNEITVIKQPNELLTDGSSMKSSPTVTSPHILQQANQLSLSRWCEPRPPPVLSLPPSLLFIVYFDWCQLTVEEASLLILPVTWSWVHRPSRNISGIAITYTITTKKCKCKG